MKSLEGGSSAVRKWQQEAGIAQEANPLPVSICSTAQMRRCRRDVVGECKVYALWGGICERPTGERGLAETGRHSWRLGKEIKVEKVEPIQSPVCIQDCGQPVFFHLHASQFSHGFLNPLAMCPAEP